MISFILSGLLTCKWMVGEREMQMHDDTEVFPMSLIVSLSFNSLGFFALYAPPAF